MQSQTLDGERPLFSAVNELSYADIAYRVQENAGALGLAVNDEHLAVINTLVDHYRQDCQQQDCRAASPHMRYLIDEYSDRGGSKYLYQLFDQAESADELGVLTLIHQLAGLPSLTHNEDEGFGTVI